MFKGVLTALVTPFKNGAVDERAFTELVERQIHAGVHGLVICGTTGEAAAMSAAEQLACVRIAIGQARGRVPIIAGTGSYNTAHTLELTRQVAELKADAALVVTPYYIKPPQRGLLEHFRQVARVGLPIVAYNVPGRTGVSLTPETVAALAAIPNVVALKEASGDLVLGSRIIAAVPESFAILSGDDFTFLPLLSIGGKGCISVLSNPAPAQTVELYERFTRGDLAGARALHYRLFPLMRALFLESNPIGAKAALALLGQIGPEIRPPLADLAAEYRPALEAALRELGLLGK